MICPDCGCDNIEGVDGCEQCGQPLVDFDPSTCELEESISRHGIAVLAPKPAVCIAAETTVREAVQTMAAEEHRLPAGQGGEATHRRLHRARRPQSHFARSLRPGRAGEHLHDPLPGNDPPAGFDRLRAPPDGYRRLPAHGGRRSLWNADGHPLRPRHPPLFVRAVRRNSSRTDFSRHGLAATWPTPTRLRGSRAPRSS